MRARGLRFRVTAGVLVAVAAAAVLVAPASGHGTKRVDDQVSLGLAKPKHFFGAVSGFHLGRANLAAICAPGRKVLLNYRDTPVQSAQLVGTDRTDAAGNWAVDVQSALKGQYQAVVKRRNVFVHGTRYICRSDHTPFMSF